MQELVAGAEDRRRYGRSVILQADPARDNHRRGQDQLENAEVLVRLPVIVMKEGAPLEGLARCSPTRRGDERLAARQRPLRPYLSPVAAAARETALTCRSRQTQGPFAP